MKKVLFLVAYVLFFTLLFTSCKNALGKSICDSLTEREIKSATNKSPLFAEIYEDVESVREILLIPSDTEESVWKPLTYKRLIEQRKYMDEVANDPIFRTKVDDEWEHNFAPLLAKADSISNYWMEYARKTDTHFEHNHDHEEEMDPNIPPAVQRYWEYQNDHPDLGLWAKGEMIKDLFEAHYISKDDYFSEKWKEHGQTKDKLANDFLFEVVTYQKQI